MLVTLLPDTNVGQAGAIIERTDSPMLATPLGIVTLVRLVQSSERTAPMLVTLLGIV